MDPSIPNEPNVDHGRSIPRSRSGENEVLEGEVIGKGVPIGQPRTGPPPPPAPPPGKPRKPGQVRRTILWTLLAIVALSCLAGGITAFVFYSQAAEPDRGSPTVTLVQYVDVRFNNRDAIRSADFECAAPHLEAIDQALDEIRVLETKYSIAITVSASDLAPSVNGDSADVEATLNVAIPENNGATSVQLQKWSFHFVNAKGWRICGAERRG
ncbi:hypothetical protein ACQP2P_02870 [Dactylosporangium sp. CA-139114]|uniref:hypothetical protein n=1 Tax=Dactylosporangium sp. CA-139114 TaxID=3239931 RepID=UPI003D98EE97